MTADPDRPLAGRTIVVCRPAADAGPLLARLTDLGATPLAVPLQALADPADGGAALSAAVARLDTYAWVAATSANGARAFADADEPSTGRPGRPPGLRVAAVGPATAAAFEAAGYAVDLVPERATAAHLVAAFPPATGGERVLAPLNEAADDTLAAGLAAKGYGVDRVDAYRMVATDPPGAAAEGLDRADAILFTAPSIVDRFVDRLGDPSVGADTPPVIACIGPRTTAAARRHQLTHIVEASTHTTEGLIDVVVASLQNDRLHRQRGS